MTHYPLFTIHYSLFIIHSWWETPHCTGNGDMQKAPPFRLRVPTWNE